MYPHTRVHGIITQDYTCINLCCDAAKCVLALVWNVVSRFSKAHAKNDN